MGLVSCKKNMYNSHDFPLKEIPPRHICSLFCCQIFSIHFFLSPMAHTANPAPQTHKIPLRTLCLTSATLKTPNPISGAVPSSAARQTATAGQTSQKASSEAETRPCLLTNRSKPSSLVQRPTRDGPRRSGRERDLGEDEGNGCFVVRRVGREFGML